MKNAIENGIFYVELTSGPFVRHSEREDNMNCGGFDDRAEGVLVIKTGKLSVALCQSRSKYARKEQWRRGKQSEKIRGQQLQSSFAFLEHFPKSIFYIPYTISKLWKSRIQRFKPYMIWS